MVNIEDLLSSFKDSLTMDGRARVFEQGKALSADDLQAEAKPEDVTVAELIRPILQEHGVEMIPEKKFTGIQGERRYADYELHIDDRKMLLEAKALNTPLDDRTQTDAVDQIQGLFKLAEVRDKYEFGIATDGVNWIIIDSEARIVYKFDIREDYDRFKEVILGEATVSAEKIEEEISQKFYDWYDALLHGGKYTDHEDETRHIAEEDCLVESIPMVEDRDEREQIAQTVMDRLIFLRFLQAKGIIDFDLLDYLSDQPDDMLNAKLRQLFFKAMNLRKKRRPDHLDEEFKNIPYLNGSLFVRTDLEKQYRDYSFSPNILRKVIDFLDSFKFTHSEERSEKQVLDPEILGYIFERAMTAAEQKDTGAYYTPKNVTRYIAEHTINPAFVDRVNDMLREKGYKQNELIDDIEELYILREKRLIEVFNDILPSFTVCDNACGSGAFLLAAADVLLDVYSRISEEIGLGHSEVALRKLILKHNLYGVDINPNAIEIARLRLWLWLVDSYEPDNPQPLPNIDVNLKTGNSLIGFAELPTPSEDDPTQIATFKSQEKIEELLEERKDIVPKYKDAEGNEAKELYSQLQDIEDDLENWLDVHFTSEIFRKTDLDKDEIQKLDTFHWAMEFMEVFEEGGFDVIIGNPPYVRQEEIRETKDYLKAIYDVYHGRADLYQYFFQRSMETLKDNGYFSYIVSNKWLRTGYGEPLREYLNQYRIEEFIDFGDTEVFKGVAAYPSIIVMKGVNEANKDIHTGMVEDQDYAPLEAFTEKNGYLSSQESLGTEAWSFPRKEVMNLMDKIEEEHKPLHKVVEDSYRGVLTGLNDAFVIGEERKEELIEQDESSKDIIKPFLTGRYIRRYTLRESGKFLIIIPDGWTSRHSGENNEEENWQWLKQNYPAVAEHLAPFEDDARERDDQGEFWWELRPCSYYDTFEEPKIIYGKIATNPRFAYDKNGGTYFNDASFMLRPADKGILGILNSTFGWFMIKQTCTKIQRGYQLIWRYFKQVPIAEGGTEELEELVDEMLDLQERKQDGEDVEDEIKEVDEKIDEAVFDLYGLDEDERELVRQETDL